MNIKESTKEGKIKILIWLSNYVNKPFGKMTKQDILDYLNYLRRPLSEDPTHKWVGSYNARQMILSKFFRWLCNPNEPDPRKRLSPPCMNGVKKLPRQEKSPYKPSQLWDAREHAIFLKYCPSKRDRCYHAIANDMSARPHEILNLKIKDIVFNVTEDGIQYAEVLITGGKTKPRTIPLIDSIPYVKEWIHNHPTGTNPES
jgi:integrase